MFRRLLMASEVEYPRLFGCDLGRSTAGFPEPGRGMVGGVGDAMKCSKRVRARRLAAEACCKGDQPYPGSAMHPCMRNRHVHVILEAAWWIRLPCLFPASSSTRIDAQAQKNVAQFVLEVLRLRSMQAKEPCHFKPSRSSSSPRPATGCVLGRGAVNGITHLCEAGKSGFTLLTITKALTVPVDPIR